MADYNVSPTRTATAPAIEINKVLRNTYMLLGLTLAFSALMAYAAMAVNAPYLGLWTLLGWFGLLYAIHKTANSVWGIFWVFAFTGFLGFTIGPVIEFYLQTPNGSDVVGMALGSTAVAFVGLSVFALTTRKDFSFLGGFLTVGIIALFGIVLLSWVFDLSAFMGAIGAAVVLLMSALILWQTSAIIHGGETNYIMATTTLYMSIYNMFSWLLLLIGMGDD
jgi:modulator of FtsH protease